MNFTAWGIFLAIIGIIVYEIVKRRNEGGNGSVNFSSSGQGYTG